MGKLSTIEAEAKTIIQNSPETLTTIKPMANTTALFEYYHEAKHVQGKAVNTCKDLIELLQRPLNAGEAGERKRGMIDSTIRLEIVQINQMAERIFHYCQFFQIYVVKLEDRSTMWTNWERDEVEKEARDNVYRHAERIRDLANKTLKAAEAMTDFTKDRPIINDVDFDDFDDSGPKGA